jgi:Zn-dependent protease
MLGGDFNAESFIIILVVLIVSLALHEFGHAYAADRLGDPGPRRDGRVTLWPDKHFDTAGFFMIVLSSLVGFGLGWGKPVMINSRCFRHPRRDMLIATFAGPLMNLLLAIFAGMVLRGMRFNGLEYGFEPSLSIRFAYMFLIVNLSLFFFNLLPLHPLDGGKIVSGLLPSEQAYHYDKFMWQFGPMILLALVLLGRGLLSAILSPAVSATARVILGF